MTQRRPTSDVRRSLARSQFDGPNANDGAAQHRSTRTSTGTGQAARLRSGLCKYSDDADVSARGFWLDADLESMLATAQPYEGAGEFAIEDLTD